MEFTVFQLQSIQNFDNLDYFVAKRKNDFMGPLKLV